MDETPKTEETERKTEIAKVEELPKPKPPLETGARVAPIVPRTVDEVARIAQAVIIAGLAPNSYDGKTPQETASKIMIGIMKGAEVGFPPITALSTIAIINGRPCIWGDGAVALVQKSGMVEKIEARFEGEQFQDDWTAIYRVWRKGQAEPYQGRFSILDAKRAHLWGNTRRPPWMEYPQRMLMARARAFALRDGFADFLMGLSIAEEAEDIPIPPETTDTAFLDDTPQVVAAE